MVSEKNFYEILGVPKNASPGMISSAFRKLSLQFHPDRNPHDKEKAETRFKEVADAQSVLSDVEKRAQYDGLLAGRQLIYQHPLDLAYIQKDIDLANSNEQILIIIALSKSHQDIKNQAARDLLKSTSADLLCRIALGAEHFEKEVCNRAAEKALELIDINTAKGKTLLDRLSGSYNFDQHIHGEIRKRIVQAKLGNIKATGDYKLAIALATSRDELVDLRNAAVDMAMNILDEAISRKNLRSDMIDDYMNRLVCGSPKERVSEGEERTASFVEISRRVAIGTKIIEYYRFGKNTEQLLKLGFDKSYLPNALNGKFIENAIEIFIEDKAADNLLRLIEKDHYRLGNTHIDSIADGIIKIAAEKVQPGWTWNLHLAGVIEEALDIIERNSYGGHFNAAEIIIKKAVAKALETGDKVCIQKITDKTQDTHGLGGRRELPYQITKIAEDALRTIENNERIARQRAEAEARAVKEQAAAEAKRVEEQRIKDKAITCSAGDVDALLQSSLDRRLVESVQEKHGKEAVAILAAQGNLSKLEELATKKIEGYSSCFYPYEVAGAAQAAVVKLATETKNLDVLMRLARNSVCREVHQNAAANGAVDICIETNDLPKLEEIGTTKLHGYSSPIYPRKSAEAAQRALIKIGKETKDLDLLMLLARNSNPIDSTQKDAGNVAIDLCIETKDVVKLDELANKRDGSGYSLYIPSQRRAGAELLKLKKVITDAASASLAAQGDARDLDRKLSTAKGDAGATKQQKQTI